MSFRIKVPNGYDLLSSVHSWIYPDIQPVPECTGIGYFGRVYHLENVKVATIIKQTRVGDSLQINYSESNVSKKELKALIIRTLGLDIDTADAVEQIRKDPIIAYLTSNVAGIRPYMSPTPFEALIKTIIQQQVSYKSANIFTKRMVLGLTTPVTFKNQLLYHFPDADTIAKAGPNVLRKYGFGYKTEYIHHAASLVADGVLDVNSLVGRPFDEVLATLLPIRGIGLWTVRVLSLAGLGNFSVFAFDDLVIQKVLGNLYNGGQRMTAKQVQEHARNWGESSNIVLYLIMCAEVLGLINQKDE
ncbi:MAG: DNA-3-methyladenine glycosylase family protein [Candidatus Thorarchaeota archaeon]